MTYRLISTILILVLAAAFPAFAQSRDTHGDKKSSAREEQAVPPVTVLSIIPAQGEPGMGITLAGNGFAAGTSVFLGNVEVAARVIDEKQLSFTLPDLAPGLYALFVRREDGVTSRTYTFTVQPQKPVATELYPDVIYECSTGKDREVLISGRNFKEKTMTLFDGAVVRSRYQGPESISFTAPKVTAGLHQIQVKNSEDTISGALALLIDGRPEITGVTRGDDYVNYYNLFIDGRNFQQNSVLVITEESTIEQNISTPPVDVRRLRAGSSDATERERLIFSSCNRLIYQRHPYSTALKSFKVLVVNPNGEESAGVSVSAP